jgi:mRNA deadenylase 3'-5' endonuclease subunit Ccr4
MNQLKIVTINVLYDSKDPLIPKSDRNEVLFHEQRYRKILSELEQANADVIALNEVSPYFLKMCEEREWVQKDYTLSCTS